MNPCKTKLIFLGLLLGILPCCGDESQAPLKIARIENIPDQFVGGEILKVVYSRLQIPMVLVDLPAKEAIRLGGVNHIVSLEAIPEAIEKTNKRHL